MALNKKAGTSAGVLPPAWTDFLASKRPAVIFGAGRQATVVHDFCVLFKKPVFCLMASAERTRWGFLPAAENLPLYLPDEFPDHLDKEDFDLVIALAPEHNAQLTRLLRERGWPAPLAADSWEEVNAATRRMFYDAYFQRKGVRFLADSDGNLYLEYPTEHGVFRIYYDIDPLYNANLLGVLNNIVLPSVFGDFSCCSAVGAYEYGPVAMRPGDTVFAVGAGIGVFSCAAAARGCAVHAFEPTPLVLEKYLRKNAALSGNITVVPCAVLDAAGKTDFYVNEDYARSLNLTRHSIHRELEPDYARIEVEATTLDRYVRENGVRRVDFIRSFTEYAEKYVFAGARETLRRFSPSSSSYCWFDRGTLKRVLSQANPAYRFMEKGMQTFAWVPGKDSAATE